MSTPPPHPKVYHILHVDRLPSVIADGGLLPDSVMRARAAGTVIGMSRIKDDRLVKPVTPHPGTFVGEYVPFYFCPRSVMLYLIWRGNHPDLAYKGGQGPIIHLEADLHAVVQAATQAAKKWAFTASNAAAAYTKFLANLNRLSEIDWPSVNAQQWGAPDVKEHKQAEFLLHGSFPWTLVERIGVHSPRVRQRVLNALQHAQHRPPVAVLPTWYYP